MCRAIAEAGCQVEHLADIGEELELAGEILVAIGKRLPDSGDPESDVGEALDELREAEELVRAMAGSGDFDPYTVCLAARLASDSVILRVRRAGYPPFLALCRPLEWAGRRGRVYAACGSTQDKARARLAAELKSQAALAAAVHYDAP